MHMSTTGGRPEPALGHNIFSVVLAALPVSTPYEVIFQHFGITSIQTTRVFNFKELHRITVLVWKECASV